MNAVNYWLTMGRVTILSDQEKVGGMDDNRYLEAVR